MFTAALGDHTRAGHRGQLSPAEDSTEMTCAPERRVPQRVSLKATVGEKGKLLRGSADSVMERVTVSAATVGKRRRWDWAAGQARRPSDFPTC